MFFEHMLTPILLAGVLVYREWQHGKQVTELTNKIMAANGTLNNYADRRRDVESTPKPQPAPKPDRHGDNFDLNALFGAPDDDTIRADALENTRRLDAL